VHFSLRHLTLGLLLAAFPFSVRAAEPTAAATAGTPPGPIAELSTGDAVTLGLIEGLTEFLPVSSTGHLIIATDMLGLESEKQLTDKSGQPLWHKPPSRENPAGVPLTLKLASDTYTVIIQVGAITAVVFLYWRQLLSMVIGLAGRSTSGLRLLRNVLLAFFPAVLIGLPTHELIDRYLFSHGAVIGALVVGAGLMFWAERWRRANSGIGFSKGEPADLTPRKAVGIGFAQCLALWPGTSRSMVTIIGGYLAGLNPAKAAEFSFLVGLPTLAGAAFLKAVKTGPDMIAVFGWGNMLLGILIAAVSAALAVKFFVYFLGRHGLALFAYYRLILAAVLAVFFYLL
jgi:undecaprenyl-diphosphatase